MTFLDRLATEMRSRADARVPNVFCALCSIRGAIVCFVGKLLSLGGLSLARFTKSFKALLVISLDNFSQLQRKIFTTMSKNSI